MVKPALTAALAEEMRDVLIESLTGDDEVARRGAPSYIVALDQSEIGEPVSDELMDVIEYFALA